MNPDLGTGPADRHSATTAGTHRGWDLLDADWNHWPDGLDDDGTWAAVAAAGLDGVELGVYDHAVELSAQRLAQLEALAAAHGVPVRAVLLSLPVDRWPGGALTGAAQRVAVQVTACAQACRRFGLDTLGVWPGADPVDASWPDLVAGLGLAADAARAEGVRLAVEYKPDTAVPDCDAALALAHAVRGTGVLLDTGHSWALQEDPAQVVRRLHAAGVLWHLHLGDAAPGGGDDDLPVGRLHDPAALIAALAEVAYAGAGALDLYGAVAGGVATGVQSARESLAALGGPRR